MPDEKARAGCELDVPKNGDVAIHRLKRRGGEPGGNRTLDPMIKSHVLYL
jgi:hypothetical protein